MKLLRKGHLQIWMSLAIMPAGILMAWLSVPKQPVQTVLQPEAIIPLPVVLKRARKQNYTIAIRSSPNGYQLQLEWIHKTVLQYPTTTIYAGKEIKKPGNAKLIGRREKYG